MELGKWRGKGKGCEMVVFEMGWKAGIFLDSYAFSLGRGLDIGASEYTVGSFMLWFH